MIKLTQLETQVLKSLINGLYAEAGFSDVDASDIAEWSNTPIESVRGALGSLVKKGIVDVESNGKYEIIYLHPKYWYLHPEWKNEKTWLPEEMVVDLNNTNNNKQSKIKVMNTVNETAPAVKRGRPVNATSARQARLAAWEAKRASGLEVKRGRPAKVKIDPKQK